MKDNSSIYSVSHSITTRIFNFVDSMEKRWPKRPLLTHKKLCWKSCSLQRAFNGIGKSHNSYTFLSTTHHKKASKESTLCWHCFNGVGRGFLPSLLLTSFYDNVRRWNLYQHRLNGIGKRHNLYTSFDAIIKMCRKKHPMPTLF